ncbi:hypothetical protein JOC37_001287 [Desulfohalotomaculum tongense]|uniref:hypothetical protein n=1 Tax=Desulforadius tongensis TaxID=1216062 RepID=UPI00195EFCCC|nr:hypothetical protein [Desulforadius tongensis]MBM7854907.1 hypothetical protein [Desulforadius tongensis]
MEQTKSLVITESTESSHNDRDLLMETYDAIDRFMERRLFPFMCVAVPVYLAAHLVVMAVR